MNETTLDKLDFLRKATITEIDDRSNIKNRVLDLGFTRKAEIIKLRKSPLGDPSAYMIKGTLIALRNKDARYIKVSIS